jgi:hypothetical protein
MYSILGEVSSFEHGEFEQTASSLNSGHIRPTPLDCCIIVLVLYFLPVPQDGLQLDQLDQLLTLQSTFSCPSFDCSFSKVSLIHHIFGINPHFL